MTKCLTIFAILLSLIVPCYGVQWLKQSTAVTVKIGPFLDDTDGKTAETGLTISQADVRLSKNGGNYAQKTDANSCTHDELGEYDCKLDTTDTGTLDRLRLMVQESGALPVWHEYQIVPANVWDSYFSTDYLQVDTVQVEGSDATDMFDDPNVWYVATTGNDSSGGNRRNDALLTIGQAVTNAQSGDTIIIAPGDYGESSVTTTKTLHLKGHNRDACVIENGINLSTGSAGSTVENLTIGDPDSPPSAGLRLADDKLTVINCAAYGVSDGFYVITIIQDLRIKGSYGWAQWDALQLGTAQNVIIEKSIFESAGTYNGSDVTGRGLTTGACKNVLVKDSIMKAARVNGGCGAAIGANLEGEVNFQHCGFIGDAAGNPVRATRALYAGVNSGGWGLAENCLFYCESNAGYQYGVSATSGEITVINGSMRMGSVTELTGLTVDAQVGGSEKTKFVDNSNPPDAYPDDTTNMYWVTWTSGNNSGEEKQVEDWETTPNRFTLESACTYDIEVGDEYTLLSSKSYDLHQSSTGTLRVVNCRYDTANTNGTINQGGSGWSAAVNAEADTALDTAIPGSPINHSINQRIKALDELLEASGAGDAAANLADSNELQTDDIPGKILLVMEELTNLTGLSWESLRE